MEDPKPEAAAQVEKLTRYRRRAMARWAANNQARQRRVKARRAATPTNARAQAHAAGQRRWIELARVAGALGLLDRAGRFDRRKVIIALTRKEADVLNVDPSVYACMTNKQRHAELALIGYSMVTGGAR